MTIFKHKTLPIEISYSEYVKLSASEQRNFSIVNNTPTTVIHHHNTTSQVNNHKTEDVLGLGTVATAAVVLPLAVVGGIFGLFD